MPKAKVYNMQGKEIEEIELKEDVFGVEPNEHIVYEAVKNQLANRRQGTQSVKTRAEVRGGGKKPWRQKGTGRARHGSIRSPIWVGGGVTFAPKSRSYKYNMPKKARRLAIKSVLTSKVENDRMIVVDELNFDSPKTKDMVDILRDLNVDKKALIVTAESEINVIKSANNLPNVGTTIFNNLNVYDILNYDSFIRTKDAVKKVEEVFA